MLFEYPVTQTFWCFGTRLSGKTISTTSIFFSGLLGKKDKEIGELKAKIAEVLAVMPQPAGMSGGNGGSVVSSSSVSTPPLSTFTPSTSSASTTLSLDLPPATDLSFTDRVRQ